MKGVKLSMNITIIGTGYVGLITGVCLAEKGHNVACIDSDPDLIATLNSGTPTIYEQDLSELLAKNVEQGNIRFYQKIEEVTVKSELVFLCVGTPSDEKGQANTTYLYQALDDISNFLPDDACIVIKSTVPVGTNDSMQKIVKNNIKTDNTIEVISNPEFLREGFAVNDFLHPDRVVLGVRSQRAADIMSELYRSFVPQDRLLIMKPRAAEFAKYAANTLLATKISFMNEMANLADCLDIDIENVKQVLGTDHRISDKFLNPGCGFGGSCFPKDIRALLHTAKNIGFNAQLLSTVVKCNVKQKHILFEKLCGYFDNEVADKTIAVWGLSFKPGTDDVREAASLLFIQSALNAGCKIKAYDPAAAEKAKQRLEELAVSTTNISFVATAEQAITNSDVLVLITEWDEFKQFPLERIKELMAKQIIFDGRNIFNIQQAEKLGFDYIGIGRSTIKKAAIKSRIECLH